MTYIYLNIKYCYLSTERRKLGFPRTRIVTVAKKNNLVLRATVLKTLGRVGCFFIKNLNLNYKDPNEKIWFFRKKSLGSAGSDR